MKENVLFPSETVIRTNLFDISQDWETPIPGFFVIGALRKEVRTVTDFTDEEATEYMFLLRKLRRGMTEVLGIENVYFFQNEDTEHGFHLWVFPRLDWMEKFGRKIQSVRPIMEYATKNMCNEDVFNDVKEYAKTMKNYMTT
jgi:diadenosine tetraphosphate (Ap4A) HIT family hydrolase